MQNPWLKFKCSSANFLSEDKASILAFNKKVAKEYIIDNAALPVPFVGNPFKSKIILLQLNPGLDNPPGLIEKKDFGLCKFPGLKRDSLKNNRIEKIKYPFYELNPNYRLCGGFRYWLKVLINFIKRKEDYLRLSKMVCAIEFFPYHSKKYRPFGRILPCQEYNFFLVREAIRRRALIVIMRAENAWLKYVPELKNYPYMTLRSKRNVVLSSKNLKKDDYEKLVRIING